MNLILPSIHSYLKPENQDDEEILTSIISNIQKAEKDILEEKKCPTASIFGFSGLSIVYMMSKVHDDEDCRLLVSLANSLFLTDMRLIISNSPWMTQKGLYLHLKINDNYYDCDIDLEQAEYNWNECEDYRGSNE
jgi:hypothetical protein